MGDFIRRRSPPIRGRARMLRLVSPTIPRALLAPHGLRLSWQIVRDRRSVELRRARVPSQPPPASVARALALVEHGTRAAVAICEAIDAGRNPILVALDACARSGMTVNPTACQIIDDPNPRSPGRPWSKTVRTEQHRAAVTAAQAKRDRRAARNLRDKQRQREARIRQETRTELHDLTRPGGAT